MAKTRSQTGEHGIKKEEQEDRKPTLLLNDASSTTRNRIAKRKSSKNRNRTLPAQQVKVEEDTDTKSLLQLPPKLPKGQRISQEQINRLIDVVVNHNMSVRKAGCAVKISPDTAIYYYNVYKNDPEKKIPLPRNRLLRSIRSSTQEQIENLIGYVVDDKMPLKEASAKAKMNYTSGYKYYNKYLQDPNHNIPTPRIYQTYTQYQKNELISYIVNDKMNITAASKRAKMGVIAGNGYYHKYFDDQNPDIATPSHIAIYKHYTQQQIKELISYIVDDKMNIVAASRKANIGKSAARNNYRQYLKDNNMEPPVSNTGKRYTQNNINEFIGYIIEDKATIKAAAKKANMNYMTGRKYYKQYLKDHNLDPPTQSYAQDKIKKFIGYIIKDKMTIKAAAKKANMGVSTGHKHYRQYRKEHNLEVPTPKHVTQDQVNKLISYIVDDKMSIYAASKKANTSNNTARKYYRQYLKDQRRDVPT